MRIGVIGASGKQGSLIMEEAIRRDHHVTAIVRDKKKIKARIPVIERDIFELTINDIKNFDVVVDAFNAPPGKEIEHQTSLKHLIELLQHTNIRLMVVGGAGSLFVDDSKTVRLSETPDFPDAYKATADNMRAGLDSLLNAQDLIWTYISPAAFFNPDGKKTGEYQLGEDIMLLNSQGKSEISYADYAIAFVDEIEKKRYLNRRMSVVSL